MKIRTTQDLRKFLEKQKLSPEGFSKQCLISNMTLRRYLDKPSDFQIPMKYWAAFDQASKEDEFGGSKNTEWLKQAMEQDFASLADSLEESGKGEHDLHQLSEDLKTKKKNPHVGQKLKEAVTTLFSAITNNQLSKKDRFLAIGALIYFLNPIDLIPDVTPGVGYLDDYAVLTMVVARLALHVKASEENQELNPDGSIS